MPRRELNRELRRVRRLCNASASTIYRGIAKPLPRPPVTMLKAVQLGVAVIGQWRRGLVNVVRRLTRGRSLGERGEAQAARWLRRQGCQIVARRCRGQLGEIDLVAVEGRTVVFVEVKTRQSQDAGHPGDAVDVPKQRRLTRLAVAYLRKHGLLEYPARFDVVAVTWPVQRRKPTIEHFPHAFEAVGYDGLFS